MYIYRSVTTRYNLVTTYGCIRYRSAMLCGLNYIDVKSENPYDLFEEWRAKSQNNGAVTNIMCIATATKYAS